MHAAHTAGAWPTDTGGWAGQGVERDRLGGSERGAGKEITSPKEMQQRPAPTIEPASRLLILHGEVGGEGKENTSSQQAMLALVQT